MANIDRSAADTAGFVPQAWAAKALDVLRSNIVLANLVARDSDFNDPGWMGKQLNIPYPGTFSAQAKASSTLATVQTPSGGASVSVTLSKHEYVDFIVEDFAAAQANEDLMMRYVEPAAIALAQQVENDLWSTAAGLNGGAVGTPGTDLSAATLRSAVKQLNINLAPLNDRFVVYSPKDEMSLVGDSNLQNFFAFAQAQTVENGSAPRLYGLDAHMSQLVPTSNHSIQVVTISGSPTGGTFTISYNGQTTAGIAFNAVASAVQSALVALSSIGAGNASVSGSAGGPYTVTLSGSALQANVAMTASAAGLTGGTPAIAVADSTTLGTYNLAAHKNALMLVTRPFNPIEPNAGVSSAIMNDQMSGLSIRVLHQYSIGNRGMYVGFDILYGTVALRPNQGVLAIA